MVMYDMAGNEKRTKDSIYQKTFQVDISTFTRGIYLLTIRDKNGSYFRKKVLVKD